MPKGIYERKNMNPNSLKNLTSKFGFKKGHPKPESAFSFQKGHKINIGRKQSEEQKEKTRIFMTGEKNALGSKGNKEKRWEVKDKTKMFGHTPWNKGIPCSIETRVKIGDKNRGRVRTIETRKKMSTTRKGLGIKPPVNYGDRNINWKGGITPENVKIRNSIENDLWRNSVFARDNYTCQKYGTKGGKLVAHHVKNFSEYPELRFVISNGITLSKEAHDEFHKKYGKRNNTREQLSEFIN